MTTILLVEDEPDLGLYEAQVLEARGYRILRCSGGVTPFAACPMLKGRSCPLVEEADLILFSCRLFAPLRHHTYSGRHLLRRYRSHPQYGRLPMLVVSVGTVENLEGSGPISFIKKFEEPNVVIDAVDHLFATTKTARPGLRLASLVAGVPEASLPHTLRPA